MKCIRVVGQGVPVRLPDAEAHRVVAIEGDGEYCPKSLWKRWYEGGERLRLETIQA